jgi:hypothetical protein
LNEGRIAIVTKRWDGVRWTRQRRARRHVRRAVFRERSTACRRTALYASAKTSAGRKWLVEWVGEGSCVRQKRVVLAPVAGVKSAEVFADPTGSRKTVNSPMTEAKGIRLRGERAISRQTIAQGRPDALRWTCMLVCALLCAIAHETAGAARTRSSLRPPLGESFGQTSGELRREIANAYSVVIGRLDRAIQYSRGGSD